MPKTSISYPDELAEPLRRWREQHPGSALADLLRIGLQPRPAAPGPQTAAEHERPAVDDLRAAVDDLRRAVATLATRYAELARHVDDHEHEAPAPLTTIGQYQQRLEDSAEARALAYHGTLTDAIGDGPRQITTAEAATIWACVTQSARDRLRMLTALNLATVDDTTRPHVWTITPV